MDDYILDRGWGADLGLQNLIWFRAWISGEITAEIISPS